MKSIVVSGHTTFNAGGQEFKFSDRLSIEKLIEILKEEEVA